MKILILGGYGFIGSYLSLSLHNQGHTVTIAGRDTGYSRLRFPFLPSLHLDFTQEIKSETWVALLGDFELVINLVGILQDKRKAIENIHTHNPTRLFKACEETNTRLIHFSALGADFSAHTDYATTKKEAEDELLKHNFDWIILRPSLVYAKGSYGGTSLLRGFAALPIIPIVGEGSQVFEPIAIEDLAKIINNIIGKELYLKKCVDITGPKKLTIKEIVAKLRAWLGFGEAKFISFPVGLCQFFCKIGDGLQLSPFNTTSLNMILHGNSSADKSFETELHVKATDFDAMLWAQPSTVQDRWHAKLYFYRVFLKICLAFFWVLSGVLPYFNQAKAIELITLAGLPDTLIYPLFYGSTCWDIGLGLSLLFFDRMKLVLSLQLVTIVLYTGIISLTIPSLWLDPAGSLVKNIPTLLLICGLFLIAEER